MEIHEYARFAGQGKEFAYRILQDVSSSRPNGQLTRQHYTVSTPHFTLKSALTLSNVAVIVTGTRQRQHFTQSLDTVHTSPCRNISCRFIEPMSNKYREIIKYSGSTAHSFNCSRPSTVETHSTVMHLVREDLDQHPTEFAADEH